MSSAAATRGSTEQAARRFFWIAAGAMALLALAAAVAPHVLPVHPAALGAISWRPSATGSLVAVSLLVLGLRSTWVVLIATITLFELPALLHDPGDLTLLAGASQSLLIGLVFSLIGSMLLQLSRSTDAAVEERRAAAATAAAAAGARAARTRAAALVHDEVLSTLRIAASGLPVDRSLLAEQGRQAQQALTSVVDDPIADAPLAQLLRDEALAIDPLVSFTNTGTDSDSGTENPGDKTASQPPWAALPAVAVHALRSALRQALENSLRHSGAAAQRQVSVTDTSLPGGLRVVISDDGSGFDPETIPADRLGLRTSVVRAMHEAGGSARVFSSPGAGTRIALQWPAEPSASTAAQDAPTTPGTPSAFIDPRSTRRSVILIAVVYAVSQSALAIAATASADPWWMPLLALSVLFAATETLRFSLSERPTRLRTTVVVGLTVLAVFLGLVGAPFQAGDLWFASAASFALVALAFRGRTISTLIGGVLIVVLVIAAGIASAAPGALIAAMSVRPFGVAVAGAILAASMTLLLHRTSAAQLSAEAELARAAWDLSARSELAERGRATLEVAGDALETVISAAPLTPEFRARAQALDGLLRDRLRAGRLALAPLLSAAMEARARGVDVAVLDDLEGELPGDFELEQIVEQAAAALGSASRTATVRLLPSNRSHRCTVVIDGEPVLLV